MALISENTIKKRKILKCVGVDTLRIAPWHRSPPFHLGSSVPPSPHFSLSSTWWHLAFKRLKRFQHDDTWHLKQLKCFQYDDTWWFKWLNCHRECFHTYCYITPCFSVLPSNFSSYSPWSCFFCYIARFEHKKYWKLNNAFSFQSEYLRMCEEDSGTQWWHQTAGQWPLPQYLLIGIWPSYWSWSSMVRCIQKKA